MGRFVSEDAYLPSSVSVSGLPLSVPMYPQDCISRLLVLERGSIWQERPSHPFFCPCLPMSPRKPCFFTPGDDQPTQLGDLAPLEAPRSLSVRTQEVDLSWVIRGLDPAPLVSGSPGNTVSATVFGTVTSVTVTSEVPSKENQKGLEKRWIPLGRGEARVGARTGSARCSAHGRHGAGPGGGLRPPVFPTWALPAPEGSGLQLRREGTET